MGLPFDFEGRRFTVLENTDGGEVDARTVFEYRQSGNVVWATYEGGGVEHGTLLALMDREGALDMRYQHLNDEGRLMTGVCRSVPERLPDGRYRVHETWRWTSGGSGEGRSIIEEIEARNRN